MRRNLVALLLTFAALVTAVLLALDLRRGSLENAVSQFQDYQLCLAGHIADNLASYLNARAPGLRALASLDTVRQRHPERMPRDLDAYQRGLTPAHVAAVSVFDEAGTIRYSTSPEGIGRSYAQCDFVAWAGREANRESVSLSLLRRPYDERDARSLPRFLLVTPVYQPASAGRPERFAGLLSLSFDLQAVLSEAVAQIEPDIKHSDVWVMEKDGTLLFHSTHPEMVFRNARQWLPACGACHLSLEHVERIVALQRGTIAFTLREGVESLAAFAPMEFGNTSWTVVVDAPYTPVAAFASKTLRKTLLLVAVVVAGLGGAVMLFWRGQRLARDVASAAERERAEQERDRLLEQTRSSQQQLEALSRRLVSVQEEERQAVARELHDEIGQLLTGVKLLAESGSSKQALLGVVEELMGRVRSLSIGLRPPMLDSLGLVPTLLWHVDRYAAQTGVRVEVREVDPRRRYSRAIETAAFRIVQEALTNVARHAGVHEAALEIEAEGDWLRLRIQDQGSGFDLAAVPTGAGNGIIGMQERARLLGGQVSIDSRPGRGTRVAAELPTTDRRPTP